MSGKGLYFVAFDPAERFLGVGEQRRSPEVMLRTSPSRTFPFCGAS